MKAILLTSSMTKIHQLELMFVFYLYFKPTKYMNLFNQLVVELRYYFMSTPGNTETKVKPLEMATSSVSDSNVILVTASKAFFPRDNIM